MDRRSTATGSLKRSSTSAGGDVTSLPRVGDVDTSVACAEAGDAASRSSTKAPSTASAAARAGLILTAGSPTGRGRDVDPLVGHGREAGGRAAGRVADPDPGDAGGGEPGRQAQGDRP